VSSSQDRHETALGTAMNCPEHYGVYKSAEHPSPMTQTVWVLCLQCQTSTPVRTRLEFARFEETHRQSCGRPSNVTTMFGSFDDVLDLPPC
jgi:hypothetical protein